ncbi:flippase-like domain-containing protein [bacterium]|nr:flippase-like domain-containing protein [candidate division CSSED10-310 bacterium]
MKTDPVRKHLRRVLKILFILLIFGYLFHYISRDWDDIRTAFSTASAGSMITAVLFFGLGTANIGICWHSLLNLLGVPAGYPAAFRSYYWSVLCKYLPGKIWGAAVRIMVSRKEGMPEGSVTLGVMLESVLLMVSAGVVGGIAMTQWHGDLPSWLRWIPVVTVGFVLFLHPRVLNTLIQYLSRRFPCHVTRPAANLRPVPLILLTWMYCGTWVLWGAGFFFCIHTFHPLEPDQFVSVAGGHTFAWLVGFVAVMFPAGIGVRELVLTCLVADQTGTGTAALAAVLARVFVLAGETAGLAVIGTFRKSPKPLDPDSGRC